MKVVQIPLRMIRPNPEQPRKIFTSEELDELAASIREYGVLQPLLVKRGPERTFTLIAGERRFRAAALAGLERVPVIIKDLENKESALIALVENVQRENLNFLEEARAYQKLMTDFELTQGEIAKKVKNIEYRSDILLKIKNTANQSLLNKEQRQENLKNAYEVKNKEYISNKNILIFDDIYTTGSTANECSKMLVEAGARSIGILTIAKD